MRHFLRLPGLLILVAFVAACSAQPGILMGPPIKVTPAIAPIKVAGAATQSATAAPQGQPAAPAQPAAVNTPAEGPQVVRTPIRLRVPAAPPIVLTPTPIPPGGALPAPTTILPTAAPVEVVSTPTTVPADMAPSPVPEVAATDTPEASAPEAPAPDLPAGVRRLDTTMNILVVGSDQRTEDQTWRSDVIMVVAVDFARREVGLISFPRDLWVTIPTVGENRINTATFYGDLKNYAAGGGIGLLRDTLAKDFDVRIDHYVKIDFESFKSVVDALGGIDMVVDCPVAGNFPKEPGSTELVYQTLQPGKYHMDGFFALRYARERKSTSDIDRARRQQRLIIGMRNRAREVNIIPRLPALYEALKGSIDTDLGLTDLIALARLGVQVDPKKAHGFIIDYRHVKSWQTPEGAMVLLPDYDKISAGIDKLFDQPSVLDAGNKPANCRVTPTP